MKQGTFICIGMGLAFGLNNIKYWALFAFISGILITVAHVILKSENYTTMKTHIINRDSFEEPIKQKQLLSLFHKKYIGTKIFTSALLISLIALIVKFIRSII